MSKEVFEPIRQGLEDARKIVENPDFLLWQQRSWLMSCLGLFRHGSISTEEMAEALERFIDFKIGLASQPSSPTDSENEK